MPDSRWDLVQTLFLDALDAEPDARDALLADADAATRHEVEELLAAHDHDGPLDALGAAWTPASDVLAVPDPPAVEGRRIGPYRLLRRLGRGGMGEVFLAARADGQFEREVALKLLRDGFETEATRARFLRERQTLARLEHPGIARLLDGGLTDDGRPYFAMEHVEGERIDRFCDRQRLGVRDRLALFIGVCAAVHHAHQRLVVHRDLKPSNVLVTEVGHVKLLDFGIAKWMEPAGADAVTVTRLLTPEYAAPEQIAGGEISTATDVYGLGVLLYELLAGQRPFALDTMAPSQVVEAVCHTEPPPPSRAATTDAETTSAARATEPEALARRLRGDLDTICLKALAPDPARRYASAEALADDVQRHLDALPVRARPASASYRMRRFVARHRRSVAASALALLALLGALGGMTWQAREASAERDRARAEAAKAEQVSAFLQRLLASADPYDGAPLDLTVAEVVREASRTVDRDLADQPEVLADVHRTLGRTLEHLGLLNEAFPHYVAAAALRDSLYAPAPHPDRIESVDDLSLFLYTWGDGRRADSLQQVALGLRRARYGRGSLEYAQSLTTLVGSTPLPQRSPRTEALLREALAIREDLAGRRSLAAAESHVMLGVHHGIRGQTARADSHFTRAEAVGRAFLAPDDPLMAGLWQDRAAIALFAGDTDRAEAYVRDALAIREARFADDHPELQESRALYATVLVERGRYAEAETLLRDALVAIDAQHLEAWTVPAIQAELGAALAGQGRDAEAEPLLREHTDRLRRRLTDWHGWTQHMARHLVAFYETRGRAAEAEPYRAILDARAAAFE